MKHRLKLLTCAGLLAFAVLMPSTVALAATGGTANEDIPQIENPLGAQNDLGDLIIAIVKEVTKIGFYIIVFFIIWSGFLFVKARGNPEALKDAKRAFLYTVIGAAILLGANLLATVIDNTVTQLRENGPGQTDTL